MAVSDLNVAIAIKFMFLAVQNSSIGDLVTHSLTHSLTESLTFTFAIQRVIPETFDN